MPSVCILTDTSAQFSTRSFPGQDRVRVVPIGVEMDGYPELEPAKVKTSYLPVSLSNDHAPSIILPSVIKFQRLFLYLGSQYDQIVGLFLSSHLNRTFYNAHEAAKNMRGGARVEIVDSHTTAIGLGLIVQTAAKAASQGYDAKGIRRIILGVIPRIYSVFCVRGLTYLQRTGHLSPAQALVGEMLGVTPFFVMDRGRLTPVQKIRSSRHQVDCLHEFVSEFEQLNHIGILQGVPPFTHEKRVLRERILEDFPTTQVSEHTINPVLAAILGPQTMGLFVWEASKNDIVLTQFGEK